MKRRTYYYLLGLIQGAVLACLAALVGLLAEGVAKADIITEIGGGIETPITNPLAQPSCQYAFVQRGDGWHEVGCGGRNPVFIGWPIAWESPNGNTRLGWFHMSHWFDGVPFNGNPELTYNCICATHKFTWRHQ